jgi:hypothetical protein
MVACDQMALVSGVSSADSNANRARGDEHCRTILTGFARVRTQFAQRYTRNMDSRGRVKLHEACIVPYRLTSSGIEFCLVSPLADSRWEFPKIPLPAETEAVSDNLRQLAESLGIGGSVRAGEPLGNFAAARGSESRSMTGYLMHVSLVTDEWPLMHQYRRLWCLAEEARVRIRRKPLRRFIDRALHSDEVRTAAVAVRMS